MLLFFFSFTPTFVVAFFFCGPFRGFDSRVTRSCHLRCVVFPFSSGGIPEITLFFQWFLPFFAPWGRFFLRFPGFFLLFFFLVVL